jgi:hypothetical protein
MRLNRAFEDAYNILYNSGMIPPAPEQIPALDADLFKNFIVTIIQLVGLIRALEDLAVRKRSYLSLGIEVNVQSSRTLWRCSR